MPRTHVRSLGFGALTIAAVLISSARAFAQAPAPPPDAWSPPPSGAAQPGAYPPGAYPPGAYPPILVAPQPPKENSINGSPLGVLFGSYSLNYERLAGGTHGFMIEGTFSHSTGTSTINGDQTSSKSMLYGGGVGYRWHWSGQQQSGFLGLMAGYTVGTGSGTVSDMTGTQQFDLTVKAPWVVANIGKRWQWDSGLNFTFRVGAGWAHYTVSSSSTDPQAQDAVKALNDLLTLIPIALDGELSLGYSF
ncbi:MAG TPA: hypothetical protein VHL80_21940 [Polyangia bacterium]|nr:hypothetical protein [Polyangia bacterium]